MTTQFFILSWCSAYGLFENKEEVKYCYDNVFADMSLNGGNKPSGIYGVVDVFTWGGWLSMWAYMIFNKYIIEVTFNIIVAGLLGLIFAIWKDVPLCNVGE